MTRLTVITAICISLGFAAGAAFGKPVSESTVEKACGDKIEGGCAGATCATGCEKMEGGKLYSYGCTFPNKTGKTKAKCSKSQMMRTDPGESGKGVHGKLPKRLKTN
jgi:hypothetical protein